MELAKNTPMYTSLSSLRFSTEIEAVKSSYVYMIKKLFLVNIKTLTIDDILFNMIDLDLVDVETLKAKYKADVLESD